MRASPVCAATLTAALLLAGRAAAQTAPPCATLPEGEDNAIPKIYIENGDTQEPLVKRLGKVLLASNVKVRIIYRNRPTCNIRNSIFNGARMSKVEDGTPPNVTQRPVRYIPGSAAFDPNTAAPECTVPDAPAGEPIELGIGATYISSCPALTQPADVAVLEGPIQAYGFIVPTASNQVAITAEEGYLALGFSEGGGDAKPWVVEGLRFKRGNSASTTLTMAAAVRLLSTQTKATLPAPDTSANLIAAVKNSPTPAATLGMLGTELYDRERGKTDAGIRMLAFKSFGQTHAYFPDSTSTAFDKQNVRDGHYLPWSPTPYMGKANGNVFASASAKRIYDLVMGTAVGDADGLLQVTQSGLVPKCAMKVTRAGDGADLALYDDPAPCSCYFEKNVSTPAGARCVACTGDATCNGGKCRLGYCEER